MTYTMGSLFSGIGGFELGFKRAGFKTSWQVEIDPYCQKVLAKNFPEAERFGDIRECGRHNLKPVDVICGGFPCQDISNAGLGAGISGLRSGLWRDMHRIISELRPGFVVVENVAALIGRGLDSVLGALAKVGYDAEWQIISAADAGAHHLRERVWIVAYPDSQRPQERLLQCGIQGGEGRDDHGKDFAVGAWWLAEPNVVRRFHGIPKRVDRIRGLGNAVVPQIPEMIARRIKQALDSPAPTEASSLTTIVDN